MTWPAVLVLAVSLCSIALFALVAYVKDRFDEMDRDRP